MVPGIPGWKHDYAVTRPVDILHLLFACATWISTVVVGRSPYCVRMAGAIVAEGLRKNFGTVE
ncbi:MAG: hypothetical protein M3P43_08960, partial [Actinomycetota bacterium]|nr:hypothetical protein [Actinomycetota bacterium]